MWSFFPRGVSDEILNLIESVSEEFPSYSSLAGGLELGSSFLVLVLELKVVGRVVVVLLAVPP